VGDAQHLVAPGKAPQLLADHPSAPAAHARVYLVKYKGRGKVGFRQDRFEREHEA
jgi:hypothetical protein